MKKILRDKKIPTHRTGESLQSVNGENQDKR
jgi:hypothetical protein